ncbi:MAG: hypothetical protein ACK5TK_05225 [Betaproteobacteria bacterium]
MTTADHGAGSMPAQIDFSQGVRGKFYRPDMKMVLPVHLDAGVASELEQSAQREGVEVSSDLARGSNRFPKIM